MTELLTRDKLTQIADVVASPAVEQAIVREDIDRTFELPTGLYLATVAAYLGFIATLATTFMNAEMVLPTAIFVLFIAAGFGVPSIWARMKPDNTVQATPYSAFKSRGVETATGHLTSGEAAVQVLILPVLIFAWGIAIVVIASLT